MARRRTADERQEELRQRIDEWRRGLPKRRAMPEDLWSEAARLAAEVGVYRVARATRVNYASLAGRLEEARERESRAAGTRFVELRGGQLLATGGVAGPVLEIEAADGTRLQLRLEAGQSVDVAAVVAAFGRRP